MTLPPTEPGKQPASAGPPISETLKFSTKRLVLAFAIAGISDAIGAFATPVPPIVWVVDIGTALLLFLVLGRHWGCFHCGCWWSGRLPCWVLLGRVLDGSDGLHHADAQQDRDSVCTNKIRFLAMR